MDPKGARSRVLRERKQRSSFSRNMNGQLRYVPLLRLVCAAREMLHDLNSSAMWAPHGQFAARGVHAAACWKDDLIGPLTVTSARRCHKTIWAGIKLPTPGINRASLSQAGRLRNGSGHVHLCLAPALGQGSPGPAGPQRTNRRAPRHPPGTAEGPGTAVPVHRHPSENGEEERRLLLRFAGPPDPKLIADWVSFNVIDTERQAGQH